MSDTPPKSSSDYLDDAVSAMLAEMRRQLRESVVQPALTPDDLRDFFRGLAPESDRAVAIVTHSFIDDQLAQLMQREMTDDIEGGAKSLFKPFAPLGTANARLKVAAALSWLSPTVYRELETIRRIRNSFAHSHAPRSFDAQEIANGVDSLRATEKGPIAALLQESYALRSQVGRRAIFIARTALLTAQAICECATAPKAIRRGLPPGSALAHDLNEAPEWYRHYIRAAVEVITEQCLVPVPIPDA